MPVNETLSQALPLSIMGLVIVFSVLAAITFFVHVLRKLDDRWQANERADAAHATERTPTVDTTTLVLIAATAATVVRGRFVVRRIRRLPPLAAQGSAWSQQGRAVLLGSHVIVKRSGGD